LDGDVASAAAPLALSNVIRVSVEVEVPAAARSVWETVGNFNDWTKFLSMVSQSRMTGQGIGAIRILNVTGLADPVVERLDLYEPRTMTLAYSIVESPLPVDHYHSVISVRAKTSSTCNVKWSSIFVPKAGATPAGAEGAIHGLYDAGLAGLQALYATKVSVQKQIAASPDVVWGIVGDFNAWNTFVPPVSSSHLVASGPTTLRVLALTGSDVPVVERLDGIDNLGKSLSYGIVSSPFPTFDTYAAKITVVSQGGGSLVTWSAAYRPIGNPADAQGFLTELYNLGLDTLSQNLAP